MKFISAGESHGKALAGIIEGLPSKLKIDVDEINAYLALRQSGYGRGGRQKIERDTVEILSGVRNMYTLGSPLAFLIKNKDYENWRAYMAPEGCDVTQKALTRVRPGHADLTGMLKYGTDDARNILERASARETAARVVAGTIARQYLRRLGIEACGYVKSVCGICDDKYYEFEQLSAAKGQPLFMLDNALQDKAVALVDELKAKGDTAGGIVEVRIKGLKSGFGSCMQYSTKLDAILCSALMSVQAVKGVEVGLGFSAAALAGCYNGRNSSPLTQKPLRQAATAHAHAPVPHASVSPLPRSHTRIFKWLLPITLTNSVFILSGKAGWFSNLPPIFSKSRLSGSANTTQ